MDNSLITEGYTLWVQLLSHHDQLNSIMIQGAAIVNLLLIPYVSLCFTTKKGRYIAAFILCEITANTYIYSSTAGWEVFFINALIYSVLYWSCRENVKTSIACATMVIFETVMILDARYYSDVKTVLYVNYEYIVTAIHLYIISTLLPWERIRRGMGNIIRNVYGLLSGSNSVAYIGHYYYAHKEQRGKGCRRITID